jgi:hypothetical protein
VAEYEQIPIRKFHHHLVAIIINFLYRTQKVSEHGGDTLNLFEGPKIGGFALRWRILWRVSRRNLSEGWTSPDAWYVYILYILLLLLNSTDCLDISGFFDKGNYDRARRRRRDEVDRKAAFLRARDLDAARQHTRQSTSAAYTRVRRPVQANAIAGPSNQSGNGVPQAGDSGESVLSPTQTETELLTRLANGSGLSQYDSLGLLETCTRCGNLFLGSFIGRHLISCTH